MAQSPSHKFGQIIGNLMEEILEPILQEYCDRRNLFLDKKGSRPGVRTGKKLTWEDKFGNHLYEVLVRYTNGDSIQGQFEEKERAIEFLRTTAG